MIYFARARLTSLVKVGYTADSTPDARLASLSTGAGPLDLLATLEGEPDFEAALHERFAAKRVHGEWFSLDDAEIAECVSTCRARRATGIVFKRGAVYHVRYEVDGRRVQESARTRDKREARRFLADRLREVDTSVWRPPAERGERPRTAAEQLDELRAEHERERRRWEAERTMMIGQMRQRGIAWTPAGVIRELVSMLERIAPACDDEERRRLERALAELEG